MSNYLKGLLTNEEVIQELLQLVKDIASADSAANELGLTPEEKSFYDALTKPQAVHDFYSNEELVAMTKELTDSLRKNSTIDWQKKESARAGMRRMIKHLLKKYHYPPEEAANALETVIKQCEQWTVMIKRIIQQNQPRCMKSMKMKYRWLQNHKILINI